MVRGGVAGDVVEHLAGVATQDGIAAEQRQVRVDLGRDRVIVAGAEVAVGLQPVAFSPHDHAQLGVGLVLDEAEDDVDAGALHRPGPPQVRLLVEARLQFDQGGDVLAVLGRLDQGGDDGAVLRGAVQRLLDRQHVGVARRLTQELDHHVEALERVVDQHVLFADGGEDVAAVVAHALRIARLVAPELQIRVAAGDQFGQLRQPQHAVDQHHVLRRRLKFADDEVAQIGGHGRLDLHAHHRAQTALLQRLLELQNQILGLFLDLDVAVADQAQHALFLDVASGEQVVDEQQQHVLERDVALATGGGSAVRRQFPEAPHLRRHRHQRVEGLGLALALQLQRQGESQVRQEGEGVRRVDRQRRQHGEQLVQELGLQPFALGLGDAVAIDHLDAGGGQLLLQLAPAKLLFGHQFAGRDVDPVQLFGRRQAIGRQHPHPLALLPLQARHARHEELVEIVGRNRQEPQPFQQRMVRVRRLFQHALIERQPGGLAIEEARRRRHQRLIQGQLRGARGGDFLASGHVMDGCVAHGAFVARDCDGRKRGVDEIRSERGDRTSPAALPVEVYWTIVLGATPAGQSPRRRASMVVFIWAICGGTLAPVTRLVISTL